MRRRSLTLRSILAEELWSGLWHVSFTNIKRKLRYIRFKKLFHDLVAGDHIHQLFLLTRRPNSEQVSSEADGDELRLYKIAFESATLQGQALNDVSVSMQH
jgi:hypothetical protein